MCVAGPAAILTWEVNKKEENTTENSIGKCYGLNVRTTSGPDLVMAKRKNEK